ncbi:MAG: dienelactone hydrolase family protein [Leptolyngbyaceae cyanobacterium]
MADMADFSEFKFTYEGSTRPVYVQGSGPAVVLLHELPGMIPQCVDLGRSIARAGFTVFLPLLFGKPNQPFDSPPTAGEVAQTLGFAIRLCISREFYCFAKREASPITEWLRALCREAYARCDRRGVGVIGMCLTGGFALPLMVDEVIMAPVLSQPSLPFPVTSEHKAALGLSPAALEQAKQRAREGVSPLGFRFTNDNTCPAERFHTLRREFGDAIELIEIDSSPGNAHHIPENAHSVLTVHFVDQPDHPTRQARDRLLAFLQERLC